jgi:Polyketide cyclase / dehydrase and lipid transport
VASATGEGFEGRSYTFSGEDWGQFLSAVGSPAGGGRADRLDHGPAPSAYPWTEPSCAAIRPCTPCDPAVRARLEELLEARRSEDHVHVELEAQPLGQPRLRVGEVLPALPVILPAVQRSRNGLVEPAADRESSPSRALKWHSSMRWPAAIAAAISRRFCPRILPCDACSAKVVSSRSRACEAATLRCTVWYMFQMVQERAKLRGAAELAAHGAPSLVSDASRYPGWRPSSAASDEPPGETSPHGPEAFQRARSSRRYFRSHPAAVEKILDAEEGRRLTDTVIGGIPVSSYRSRVTLAPVDGGTPVSWPLPGTSVWLAAWSRPPANAMPQMVEALVDAVKRQAEERRCRSIEDVGRSRLPTYGLDCTR